MFQWPLVLPLNISKKRHFIFLTLSLQIFTYPQISPGISILKSQQNKAKLWPPCVFSVRFCLLQRNSTLYLIPSVLP